MNSRMAARFFSPLEDLENMNNNISQNNKGQVMDNAPVNRDNVLQERDFSLNTLDLKDLNDFIIQENGQVIYTAPDVRGPPPKGTEIFISHIPQKLQMDQILPVVMQFGSLYNARLMMDFGGGNRGFAYVRYCSLESANAAVNKLNGFEIIHNCFLKATKSTDNCRLFLGQIKKSLKKEEIFAVLNRETDGLKEVILYLSSTDKTLNRGFCFAEYEDHKAAAMARRKLVTLEFIYTHWAPKGSNLKVDWAIPEAQVDEHIMSKTKKAEKIFKRLNNPVNSQIPSPRYNYPAPQLSFQKTFPVGNIGMPVISVNSHHVSCNNFQVNGNNHLAQPANPLTSLDFFKKVVFRALPFPSNISRELAVDIIRKIWFQSDPSTALSEIFHAFKWGLVTFSTTELSGEEVTYVATIFLTLRDKTFQSLCIDSSISNSAEEATCRAAVCFFQEYILPRLIY